MLGDPMEVGRRWLERATPYDGDFSDAIPRWAVLDGHFVPTRHPNSLPGGIPAKVYAKEAAENAVELAREAVEFVGMKLQEMEEGR